MSGLLDLVYQDWTVRGLGRDILAKYRCGTADYNGARSMVCSYCDKDGLVVAQKVRVGGRKDQTRWVGDATRAALFGQHLWPSGGRYLQITEGEIDALTVAQIDGGKFPVVSVKNGAGGALKDIKAHLAWVESFERIVLMFDQDEPGQEAAEEIAKILPPGRVGIAKWDTYKDPNEALQAGNTAVIKAAFWNAIQNPWSPRTLVTGADLEARLRQWKKPEGGTWFMPTLNEKLDGLRFHELNLVTAGTGSGKSQFIREQVLSLVEQGHKVGYVALEEVAERTALGLVGLKINKKIHREQNPSDIEGFDEAWDAIKDRVVFHDGFAGVDTDSLHTEMRYLRYGFDCRFIVVDHISIVTSARASTSERQDIDEMMTRLAQLAVDTGVCIIAICHLKTVDGKSHENGAEVLLSHLRGSKSLSQLSFQIVALERDQQSPTRKHYTRVRVLKDRWDGQTGVAGWLYYDSLTGRMTEIEECLLPTEGAEDNEQTPW